MPLAWRSITGIVDQDDTREAAEGVCFAQIADRQISSAGARLPAESGTWLPFFESIGRPLGPALLPAERLTFGAVRRLGSARLCLVERVERAPQSLRKACPPGANSDCCLVEAVRVLRRVAASLPLLLVLSNASALPQQPGKGNHEDLG